MEQGSEYDSGMLNKRICSNQVSFFSKYNDQIRFSIDEGISKIISQHMNEVLL